MPTRRWSLCLLFGPAALATAQPVPAIIKDVNEISDGTGNGPGSTPGAPRRTASSLPNELVRVGADRVFFAATGEQIGRELWSHKSSIPGLGFWNLTAPTMRLSSDPRLLTPVATRVFLAADVPVTIGTGTEFRPRVLVADGVSAPAIVTLTAGPDPYVVQDIATVGDTALVAVFASPKVSFWQTAPGGTTAAKLLETPDHSLIADLLDCGYGQTDGFVAFTSVPSNPPTRRVLSALKYVSGGAPLIVPVFNSPDPAVEVDNLCAIEKALYFTVKDGATYVVNEWTVAGGTREVRSDTLPMSHLMAATFGAEKRLYFVAAGSSSESDTVWRYYRGQARAVDWPDQSPGKTTEVRIIDSLVVNRPHVLGTGSIDGVPTSAIWRTTDDGLAMQPYKYLPGWSSCSQLVANADGKFAFVGQYEEYVSVLSTTHLGFVTSPASVPVAISIPDLLAGSVPSSLLALDTRVVFSAAHARLGIEPWYCDFP